MCKQNERVSLQNFDTTVDFQENFTIISAMYYPALWFSNVPPAVNYISRHKDKCVIEWSGIRNCHSEQKAILTVLMKNMDNDMVFSDNRH